MKDVDGVNFVKQENHEDNPKNSDSVYHRYNSAGIQFRNGHHSQSNQLRLFLCICAHALILTMTCYILHEALDKQNQNVPSYH